MGKIGNTLVRPEGKVMTSYTSPELKRLTAQDILASEEKIRRMRNNLEKLYANVYEGTLLDKILKLTSRESFLSQTLDRVLKDSSFSNSLVDLLSSQHTYHTIHFLGLPWLSILAEQFTCIDIPENIEAINIANSSFGALTDLVTNNRRVYDAVMAGVKTAVINPISVNAEGLEVTVLADNNIVQPKMIKADSRTIEHEGTILYNGLPGDRAKHPTFLLPEDARLSMRIKNTSSDKVYMVVPSINGMPIKVDSIYLSLDGFLESDLPVLVVEPNKIYLKPGETVSLPHFFCNSISITDSALIKDFREGDIYQKLSKLWLVSTMLGRIFEENLSDDERALLNDKKIDKYLRQQIWHESSVAFTRDFILSLKHKAKKTPLYMGRPVVADKTPSSKLDNPFLGSIGLSIVEVYPPPVEAQHQTARVYHRDSTEIPRSKVSFIDGSSGIAGLGQIKGGHDQDAASINCFDSWGYGSCIHRFKGFVPLNLMSIAYYMRVIK